MDGLEYSGKYQCSINTLLQLIPRNIINERTAFKINDKKSIENYGQKQEHPDKKNTKEHNMFIPITKGKGGPKHFVPPPYVIKILSLNDQSPKPR